MKREDAIKKFREEEAEYLDEVKAGFLSDIQERVSGIADCLKQVFKDLRDSAENQGKEPVMFIHFSMIRTDFLNQTYQFMAQAMNRRWYMDKEPAETVFSLEPYFSVFTKVREKLDLDSQKYIGKVCKYDVDNLLMETGMECNRILSGLLLFVFRDIEENEDFKAIPKEAVWGIRWGEYRDESRLIACADREKKEQRDYNRAMRETKENAERMVSSFWYGADLKDSECNGTQFCFAQFENCSLQGMKFRQSNFTGARFRNCSLKSCDFSDSCLRQASFVGCRWEDCDFSGSDMEGCDFYEDDVPFLHLDADQLQVILIDRREEG